MRRCMKGFKTAKGKEYNQREIDKSTYSRGHYIARNSNKGKGGKMKADAYKSAYKSKEKKNKRPVAVPPPEKPPVAAQRTSKLFLNSSC